MIKLFNVYILTKKEVKTLTNDITIAVNNSLKGKGYTMTAKDMVKLKYELNKGFKIFDKVKENKKNV